MDRLQNPYQPGAGTRPPALIGRDELIDGFGVALRRTLTGRSGKSCMLVGLRGVGKTVLLNRFAEIAEAEGVKVGFIEASENGDFRTLLAVRLRRISSSRPAGRPAPAIPGWWWRSAGPPDRRRTDSAPCLPWPGSDSWGLVRRNGAAGRRFPG